MVDHRTPCYYIDPSDGWPARPCPSATERTQQSARGDIDVVAKVMNCQNSGGLGAVIYNNVAGSLGGTMGTTVSAIAAVTASDTDGRR